MDINITFGSDAHEIDQVGFKYDEAVALAKEIGYSKCVTFENREKQIISF